MAHERQTRIAPALDARWAGGCEARGEREMIVITNGTSPFSRLVVQHLLTRVPASEIAVTTVEPEAAADLGAMGIDVRQERFDPTLDAMAFGAADRVLVVSRP